MTTARIAAMHLLAIIAIASGVAGCAFQRFSTPLNAVPAGRVPNDEFPDGMYTFTLESANVPPKKISGLPWDDDGSGPDPFVRLYVDNRRVFESAVLENQVHPTWRLKLPRNVLISSASLFRLELWDYDTTVSADPIGRIERRGLPLSAARGARARVELEGRAIVTIEFGDPVPQQGAGLSVEVRSDALRVFAVELLSPAARAGIHSGDRILAIGGQRVADVGGQRAMSLLSLATGRGAALSVTDASGQHAREVVLDRGYVWQIME